MEFFPLWDTRVPFEARPLSAVRAEVLHRADAAYPFLHDSAVTAFGGRLLAAWYNCTGGEICGHTLIRAKWSDADLRFNAAAQPLILAEEADRSLHPVPVAFYSARDGPRLCIYKRRPRGELARAL